MAKSHHDKIAVISGGANGIGQAFAQRLAQDGAHIVIADVAPAGDTVKMVEQAGRHALACKCDVSSEVSVKALADQGHQTLQPLRHRQDEYAHAASMKAIKRPEVPADLVGTVSFLSSDDAAFITGQTLNVDGGRIRS